MPKKPKVEPIKLTVEQITAFQSVVRSILDTDKRQEDAEDYDGHTEMLNQLFYSMPEHEFEAFKRIIQDADDAEFRSPK